MKVYMLRDNDTGLFYRRMKGYAVRWVEQKRASVWSAKNGPAQIISYKNLRRPRNLEIVPYILKEIE